MIEPGLGGDTRGMGLEQELGEGTAEEGLLIGELLELQQQDGVIRRPKGCMNMRCG